MAKMYLVHDKDCDNDMLNEAASVLTVPPSASCVRDDLISFNETKQT